MSESKSSAAAPSRRARRRNGGVAGRNLIADGTGTKLAPDGLTFSLHTPIPAMARRAFVMPVFTVAQMVDQNTITASTIITTAGAYQFTAGALDNWSSFATVFDQYRISLVEQWFIPYSSDVTFANGDAGLFYSVIDVDDATTLSTVAAAQDYPTCVVASGIQGQYRRFRPHTAVAAYGGSFSLFENQTAPWIDCASGSVYHYGLKYVWTIAGAAYSMRVQTRLTVQFRNVR